MNRLSLLFICLALAPQSGKAEALVARHTIRAQTILQPQDIQLVEQDFASAITDPKQAVGLETRIAIYAGTPLQPSFLQPPAIISRNQIVPLVFSKGGLTIRTEGRALDRAAAGDSIRFMNLSSKAILRAQVQQSGEAIVISE